MYIHENIYLLGSGQIFYDVGGNPAVNIWFISFPGGAEKLFIHFLHSTHFIHILYMTIVTYATMNNFVR